MLRAIVIFAIVVASLGIGIGTAWWAADAAAPVDSLQLGSWSTWPNAGTSNTDPYSRARLARHGELPLGAGEGLAVYAESDVSGNRLRGDCTYIVDGQTPPARLWTFVMEKSATGPRPEQHAISAIGSDSIVRQADGSFQIVISPRPQPGNWLSSAASPDRHDDLRIVVRLYDTTARTLTDLTDFSMPEIRQRGCP